jgi:hypothetical protein
MQVHACTDLIYCNSHLAYVSALLQGQIKNMWVSGFPTLPSFWTKIRYYKDVTLCENYVRDFFIAAILPVSVKFHAINL